MPARRGRRDVATGRFNVLFVCMGNICRSPTAHGVFLAKVEAAGLAQQVGVDSAGTHGFHRGAPPDRRSQRHALRRGYDLSALRGRQLSPDDFLHADLLLAMDEDNLALAQRRCPPPWQHKLRLLMSFARNPAEPTVPDPYTGGPAAFETVLDLVEEACDGLLDHVRAELAARRRPAGAQWP